MARTRPGSLRPRWRVPLAMAVAMAALLQFSAASAASQPSEHDAEVPDCNEERSWLVHPGGDTLTTPAEMANFGKRYRSVVGGDLTIEGAAVLHTDMLACLERIEGDLWIMNSPQLQRISLPALRTLNDLWIHDNAKLQEVDLPALTKIVTASEEGVGGHLRIHRNPALARISAPQLVTIGGAVELLGLSGLSALSLPKLQQVGRHVLVRSNKAIRELFLPALASVGDSLGVDDAAALTRVQLPRLGEVGGDLWLGSPPDSHQAQAPAAWLPGNPSLKHIALPALVKVGGSASISHNRSLAKLQLNPELSSGRGIEVRDCPKLSSAALNRLGTAGDKEITLCGLRDSPPCR